jgi:hypothetical protein
MNVKYKFRSGATVEGTVEQILAIAKTLGETVNLTKLGALPRGYYNSSSKGLLQIKEMNTVHLRSALLKMSREHFGSMDARSTTSNGEFCAKYLALADNPIVEDLFTELSKRK